tara:strand:- start:7480 stop:9276 length:1797 start_codon:yes stop_codon:yes gene_type:complete
MPDDQKKIVPIDYTSRDFRSIRDDLLEIAERYYPDNFQDFTEASFGSLMIDAVAYVGDQLSFYLDYNVNESFLDTAYQYNNIIRHGRILGYKSQGRASTYGQISLYILVPASAVTLGPDNDYIPILKRGAKFTSSGGVNFILTENVDFADPSNRVVVARTDASTGAPTFYAIRAFGNVVSGVFEQEQIELGSYERFRRVELQSSNIAEIISVTDSQGNEFYEVDYLAQDIIFQEITNRNFQDDNVPSILQPMLVSRKFVVEYDRDSVALQFGSGDEAGTNVLAEPQTVAIDIFGKDYVSSTTFDPSRLSANTNYGISPSNTTLNITYRTTDPLNSNVSTGQLNNVNRAMFNYKDRTKLVDATVSTVNASLEVTNEKPIVGDVTYPDSDEIKQRIYDTFPTQNRAVTQTDYESLCYRMPVKFGSIKRVSAQRDPDSQKRNINMYVVSEDKFGKLIKTNDTIKNNLKTWLNNYRMISDTIDILDPFILNFGINFVIKSKPGTNKFATLEAAIQSLRAYYSNCYYIGQPFSISDIYSVLKDVPDVLDVLNVQAIPKNGLGYSQAEIDINENTSPDGDHVVIPKNAIVEVKFPEVDIVGKVR